MDQCPTSSRETKECLSLEHQSKKVGSLDGEGRGYEGPEDFTSFDYFKGYKST